MSILIRNPIDSVAKRKHKDYLTPKVFSRLITLSPSFFSSIFTSLDIIFIYIFYRGSGKWKDMTSKTNVDFPRVQIATADDPEKALHISFVMLFSLVFFMQYPVRVLMLRHQRNTSLRQRKSKVYGFLYTLAGVFHLIFTLQTIFGIVSSSFVSGDVNEDYKLDKETLTMVFYSFFHTGFTFYVLVWLFEDILILLGHPEQLNILLMVIFRFLMLNIFVVSEVFWVVMVSMGNFRTTKFLGCNKDTFYGINQLVFLCGQVIFLISISMNTGCLGILECLRYSPCLNRDREMTIQLLDDIELESNRNVHGEKNFTHHRSKYRKRRVQRRKNKILRRKMRKKKLIMMMRKQQQQQQQLQHNIINGGEEQQPQQQQQQQLELLQQQQQQQKGMINNIRKMSSQLLYDEESNVIKMMIVSGLDNDDDDNNYYYMDFQEMDDMDDDDDDDIPTEDEGIMPPGVYSSSDEEFEYHVDDRDFHSEHCSTCTSADEEVYEVKSVGENIKNNKQQIVSHQKKKKKKKKKKKMKMIKGDSQDNNNSPLIFLYDEEDTNSSSVVVHVEEEEEEETEKIKKKIKGEVKVANNNDDNDTTTVQEKERILKKE